MRKSKFSESQIVAILKEGGVGLSVAEVCRKHGISAATWYGWKSKYAGATVSDLTRMRARWWACPELPSTGSPSRRLNVIPK